MRTYLGDRLRDRAQSYWRDHIVFGAEGNTTMALAYSTIADELRKVAQEIEEL